MLYYVHNVSNSKITIQLLKCAKYGLCRQQIHIRVDLGILIPTHSSNPAHVLNKFINSCLCLVLSGYTNMTATSFKVNADEEKVIMDMRNLRRAAMPNTENASADYTSSN